MSTRSSLGSLRGGATLALAAILGLPACTATEGGNPEPVPDCSGTLMGFLGTDISLPENARGIPLRFDENIRTDKTRAPSLLEVTRNGTAVAGFELKSKTDSALNVDEPLTGSALLVLTEPLTAGDELVVTRTLNCSEADAVSLSNSVQVTVTASAPPPTSLGQVELLTGDPLQVRLTLAPEVGPWVHALEAVSLTLGEQTLAGEGLTELDDRDMLWQLHTQDCTPCGGSGSGNGAPAVCFSHQWPAGPHSASAVGDFVGTTPVVQSTPTELELPSPSCAN